MIDKITFRTETTRDGKGCFQQATLWIMDLPFTCDIVSEYTEQMLRRIASDAEVEIMDFRAIKVA